MINNLYHAYGIFFIFKFGYYIIQKIRTKNYLDVGISAIDFIWMLFGLLTNEWFVFILIMALLFYELLFQMKYWDVYKKRHVFIIVNCIKIILALIIVLNHFNKV